MLVLLLIFCVPYPQLTGAAGQDPPARFVRALHVDLINVDVFASDRSGRPVTGLQVEDFELLVDGEPIAVTHFQAPGSSSIPSEPRADPATGDIGPARAAGEQRSYLVIFVDNQGGQPLLRNQALQALANQLSLHDDDRYRFMLVSMSDRVQILHRFTDSNQELLARLGELQSTSVGNPSLAEEHHSLLEDISRLTPNVGTDVQIIDRRDLGEQASALARRIMLHADALRDDIRGRLMVVDQFLRQLAGLPGQKVLLYIGEGFDSEPGSTLLKIWERRFAKLMEEVSMRANYTSGVDNLNAELDELAGQANTSGVTCYTLFTAGSRRFAPLAAESGSFSGVTSIVTEATYKLRDSLTFLADATGGLLLQPGEDTTSGLSQLVGELGSAYSIGFTPPGKIESDQQSHQLQVKVRRKGVQLRHRESYRRKTTDEWMSEMTYSVLLYEPAFNPLGASLVQTETEPKNERFDVTVTAVIPLAKLALVPVRGSHIGRIKIYFAVRDDQGSISGVRSQPVPITIPNASLQTALGQEAALPIKLSLAEGHHELAVTLRDDLSGQVSTIITGIDLPVPAS
jgi:VWFA-related protein